MTQTPAAFVSDFYQAISARDGDRITAMVDAHFADDAAIEWPPSLPHGGRVEGVRRVRSVFAGIAKSDAPVGVTCLKLIRAFGDDAEVAAWISFDWKHPGGTTAPNSALELWRFADGKVTEILAYYWDTDAISHPTLGDQQ